MIKKKVAIGEPGFPESATSNNRRVLTRKEIELSSSDHKCNFTSVTPSVTLLCEIPELAQSSFYRGTVCVGVKGCSVF